MAGNQTQERLRRALLSGDAPLSALAVRTASLGVIASLGVGAVRAVRASFDEALHGAVSGATGSPAVLLGAALRDVLLLATPCIAAGAVTALLGGVSQTGGVIAWRRPARTEREPLPSRAYAAARGLVTAVAVWIALLLTLAWHGRDLASAIGQSDRLASATVSAGSELVVVVVSVLAVVSLGDIAVQRIFWRRRASLSPSAERRERRDREGDPYVKEARRRLHREAVSASHDFE
jgi:flagellar biosynthesis protein FlhB